ncbi:MAG TPA: nucleoside triphosphate pyrophosphohydrolase [Anaerolineae bacterium]|jgi:tetrapyrrole methylase family protein/MazG family protein|nr:nucleoside triphosphate pyrophosphohydrolase [Anaerolineae bacterium]
MPGLPLSKLANLFTAFELETLTGLSVLHADELAGAHVPPFSPDLPALLVDVSDVGTARAVLLNNYPLEHPVRVQGADGAVRDLFLAEWGDTDSGSVFLPARERGHAFETFQEIIAHLRAPDGCPWDRKQTHQSLRQHLIEEAYEVIDAIDAADPSKLAEEFGDVLLQIFLHAQIGYETGEYRLADVVKGINDKIIRRHPHVFAETIVDGEGQVLTNWEAIKKEERKQNGEEEKGILDGVPKALPALHLALEYQDRAARVGFDWPEVEGVLDKIREEIDEVHQSQNQAELVDELGDLFFVLVNLARWKKIDAEAALQAANRKFKRRFGHIEKRARELGRALPEMSLEEMDALWDEAKGQGL